jgi:hypothetical protein
MEYYQEHLRGRRFILYTDHKPLETLGTLHTKTMNRLQLAIIHTDGGKEFLNKIAAELYQKLDIKTTHTAPAHPQCNSQAEVFNKSLAKFLKNVVDETALNWV